MSGGSDLQYSLYKFVSLSTPDKSAKQVPKI